MSKQIPTHKKKRLVIVGGGFGGVKTALRLAKEKNLDITLISDKDHFLYYPALYATATGGSHLQSVALLADIFSAFPQVRIIQDTVAGLDAQRHHITTVQGKHYEYDYVVLAIGVVTSYFGIEGLAEFSYGIKSYPEVKRFKKHLHDELVADRELDKNYMVVGAGPTGVELSAAMESYLEAIAHNHKIRKRKVHVNLIEAAPRVLPRMSERASQAVEQRLKSVGVRVMTNKKVESQDDDSIIISGKDIPSRTVVWTSGVSNHPFYKEHSDLFKLAPNGRVIVDSHLEGAPNVYVIGDNAATQYTGLAQTALHDAIFVSKVIGARLHGRAMPMYKAKNPPVVIPVGKNWAIFEWHKLRFGGWAASIVRRMADAIGYHDVLPIGQALGAWKAEYVQEEDCPVCAATL